MRRLISRIRRLGLSGPTHYRWYNTLSKSSITTSRSNRSPLLDILPPQHVAVMRRPSFDPWLFAVLYLDIMHLGTEVNSITFLDLTDATGYASTHQLPASWLISRPKKCTSRACTYTEPYVHLAIDWFLCRGDRVCYCRWIDQVT
jgi:hypothetical protein